MLGSAFVDADCAGGRPRACGGCTLGFHGSCWSPGGQSWLDLMWLAEAVSQTVSAHRSAALGPREPSGCCLAVHLAGGSGQVLELVPALWWVELGLGFCGDRAGSVVGRGNQGTRWSLSACCWVKLCPCS